MQPPDYGVGHCEVLRSTRIYDVTCYGYKNNGRYRHIDCTAEDPACASVNRDLGKVIDSSAEELFLVVASLPSFQGLNI